MHYVYILTDDESEIYIGCTGDLKKRLAQHASGRGKATSGNKWTLAYYEAYRAEADAWQREQRLKDHGQAKRQLKDRITTSLQLS
ncbi:GIY-YIG nuclease family protein [Candidatus Kaiserbacteria bacterium]|nr:GIY-YIG nuclease family protein [Candidatus Kaiserbacteria bacterium]